MVFSSKISKFGKGDNISLYMETEDKRGIFFGVIGVLTLIDASSFKVIAIFPVFLILPFRKETLDTSTSFFP